MSGDPVPAITEAAATGEIAALYDDIRRSQGTPVVNLVWRHLATFPGALAWAWGAVRPVYVDGSAAALAAAYRRELTLPALPGVPREVLGAAGIDAAAERGIAAVLASYDRSNTTNLIALSALLRRLDGEAGMPGEIAAMPEPTLDGPLPRLLAAGEMTPATAALVQRLNLIGERDDGRIVASMYRHLAHWPGFLALIWALLAPLDAEGRLAPAIAANLATARDRATLLADRLQPTPPPAEVAAAACQAITRFVEHPIGKMVTICRLLRHNLPVLPA
ncbi:hypothetical protein [Desertibaculum subflavum]|uniref:hypothetical protein n=1 Tax=Desertibaculum subflavum TaxID=2268458 RepID=UPI000E665584